ncbi:GNAT family N-acetyltransferase [Salaquimonas pukyongi]|uniref:GNAT family N-acetyltransferase n=1 Tax=Salaquimonas pukyongi TaxID=2712698 RepID=UPI00096B88CE|nr:GNAT family N-acetyltransferase [Salaquimonas pukyongi]
MQIKLQNGFPPALKPDAAALYFAAFEGKIGGILGRDGRGVRFIERVIDPGHAISAVSRDGNTLYGIAGFKTSEGALVGGELSDLAAIHGWFGALWRGLILSLLERDLEDDVLLMDGIAVSQAARGQGVGTKLLQAIFKEAESRGKKRIRLDVIDTNPRARALYERLGFVKTGSEHLGPLKFLFGFSSSARMERPV